MGDKSKGKSSGKDNKKKAKVAKAGNRPHEQRQREELLKQPGSA